jgi:hypothetical protein
MRLSLDPSVWGLGSAGPQDLIGLVDHVERADRRLVRRGVGSFQELVDLRARHPLQPLHLCRVARATVTLGRC